MFEAFAMELRMQKPVYLLSHHESPLAQGLEFLKRLDGKTAHNPESPKKGSGE